MPGVLKVKVGETWESIITSSTGGGVADVLHVGPDAPTDPAIELWADTDAVATGGGGWPLVPFTPFSVAGWTWVNQGTTTVTETPNKTVFLSCPNHGNDDNHLLMKAMPAGTPTITVASMFAPGYLVASQRIAVALYESGTGKLLLAMSQTTTSGINFSVSRYLNTAGSGWSANLVSVSNYVGTLLYVRVQVTATQYLFAYSFDGVNFQTLVAENKNAFLTTAADRIGIGVANSAALTLGASFLSWSET